MLFNSPVFLLFFVVVYGLYRLMGLQALGKARVPLQNSWLLLASYAFYAYWDWRFLGLIVVSTLVDYGCGRMLDRLPDARGRARRAWLLLSVVTNLSILGTFKYLGWLTTELDAALTMLGLGAPLPVLELILPVGLSFYTFQSMAYTIDVYRRETPATRSFIDFATYVAYFPQLVAGPIERSSRLLPQLQSPRSPTAQQLALGGHLILWGYFKKLVVADNLAVVVSRVFEGDPSGFLVLVGAYAFTWQIYCDFSGYTDIARGLSKLMGIELSVNFRLPFFASGPSDLWRRWHISLSQWLRDYLYVPLGGNRRGRLRTQLNLMLTMLLGGLWHGANWTFIAWGAWHGAALALQRALPVPKLGWPGRVAAVIATFHLTCLGFVVFRAHDLGQVVDLARRVLSGLVPAPGDTVSVIQLGLLVTVPLLIELAMHLRGDDLDLLVRLPRPVQAVFSVAMIAAVLVLGASYGRQFIYFQF
ncbi:MAG: MBOAT family protein [Alphaproteobacteria bacterium]|nr:MBOAT family protein [Alphaproteobacteria bacterium]